MFLAKLNGFNLTWTSKKKSYYLSKKSSKSIKEDDLKTFNQIVQSS